LPLDYLHILNCICNFKVRKQIKCYDAGTYVQFGAFRLTSDIWSKIINNFYMRPSYKKPYFFIHNVNKINDGSVPTNPYNPDDVDETGTGFGTGTDIQIKKSLSQQFLDFTNGLELKDNESFTATNYIAETETLEVIETQYKAFTGEDGILYAIVFDVRNKEFKKFPTANIKLAYESHELQATTQTDALSVQDDILIIDESKLGANFILVDNKFLEDYG